MYIQWRRQRDTEGMDMRRKGPKGQGSTFIDIVGRADLTRVVSKVKAS